ncbi:MAG: hypothetical protein J7J82_01945 [Staphylothermus sp.]|nr:hypothetical protein [Staphylothermus sp.]
METINPQAQVFREFKTTINEIVDLISNREYMNDPDKVLARVDKALYLIEQCIEQVKEEIRKMKEKYAFKHGIGYFTKKKNKGYVYVVFRTYTKDKDIYLPRQEALKVLELKERLNKLYKTRRKLREIKREIRHYSSMAKYIYKL